jgi:Cu-processing system permease protein
MMAACAGTLPRAAGDRAPRESRLDFRTVLTLARKEIRDSLRNRWFVLYTIAFAALALALSFLSQAGTGLEGYAGFGRTAASLINLVILIVPLMALTAGAASLAGERERGTLAYLLAQPITRLEILLGKYLGLAAAMTAALALGFGLSATIMAVRGGGTGGSSGFLLLVGISLVLALAMLSVGFLVSAIVRKAGVAMGAAIFLWLTLVFLGDLGLMGSALVMKLPVGDLFHLSLLNPLQVFKMTALGSINASLDVLGPAGIYAMQTYGSTLNVIFAAVLAAWVIVPLAVAQILFSFRGAT